MSIAEDIEGEASDEPLRAALNRALRELHRVKANREDLVEAIYRAVRDAVTADPFTPVPAPHLLGHGTGKREVALWHITDLQGGKRTPSYDSGVMQQRVRAFMDTAERITEIQRADHPVDECVILFGGDMLEGLWNYPTQPFEVDASLFTQVITVSNLLAEVVARALGFHDAVTVVAEWGNHGRIGSKRDAVPRSDNMDRMCYAFARATLGEQPRLRWEDSAEDIQVVEIGNYRALSMHGDETGRNGYVSVQTFLTYLTKLKGSKAFGEFRDVYTGHRHTHGEDQFSDGEGRWYRTGSTESDNRYARDGMGVRGLPSQRLHFVDPSRGRVTAQYQVELD